MKTVIVVPGFKHDAKRYTRLLAMLREQGFAIVIVQPHWNRQTIHDWLAAAEAELEGVNTKQAVLIGFSFGAMIAAGLAARLPFKKVLLCSLSPYFAEDIKRAKQWWLTMVGTKRTEAFAQYSFAELTKKWKQKQTVAFLGTIEIKRRKVPVMAERGYAAGTMPNSKFVAVPGVGHNVNHPNYVAAIKAEL